MKLVNSRYLLEIEMAENCVEVLVVEKNETFTRIVTELWNQSKGNEGGFVLSEYGKIQDISKKMKYILEPISVDINEKRLLTKMYQEIMEYIVEEQAEEIADINSKILNLIDKAIANVPYEITSAMGIDITALLKLYDVKVENDSDVLSERIANYVRVVHQILNIDIFVFVNLKSYLSQQEL